MRVSFVYTGGVRSWILRIKKAYQYLSWRELQLEHLPLSLRRDFSFDAISFIPSDPIHNRKRLFECSRTLANRVSLLLNRPVVECFERIEFLQPQKLMKRQHRLDAAQRTLHWKQGHFERPQKLLLIDDVMTTGASFLRCAELLSAQGIRFEGFCIARQMKEDSAFQSPRDSE